MALNLQNYKRISGLTEKNVLNDTDVFAVDNSNEGASQKVAYSTLKALLKTYLKIGDISSGHYVLGNTVATDLKRLDTAIYDTNDRIDDVLADLAPVQTSTTASRAYTTGAYLVYQDQLYLVTQDIAQGGTISVGTNVVSVTVGSVLVSQMLAFSDAYSASKTYVVGDYCIRNNTLYKCKTAITTAEAWNSSHWTATTVAEEIKHRTLFLKGVTVSVATNGTIINKSDSRITAKHTVTGITFANMSAITSELNCTPSAGKIVVTGTCTTTTTADILLTVTEE